MRSLSLVLLLLLSPITLAQAVLDQYQNSWSSVPDLNVGGISNQKLSQTFTAGITGQLHHLMLVFSCEPTSLGLFSVEIQTVGSDGKPDGGVLGSVYLQASTLQMIPISLREVVVPEVHLVAGTKYAIVMDSDYKAVCVASRGPVSGAFFSYPRGNAFHDSSRSGTNWNQFSPDIDLPFYTYMGDRPRNCEFASSVPNNWLPHEVPVCACLSDRINLVNQCRFSFPGFTLLRDLPLPGSFMPSTAKWTVIPLTQGFPGVLAIESGINARFAMSPVQFAAGLLPNRPSYLSARYRGFATQTRVSISFPSYNGLTETSFTTTIEVPENNGQ